eukprot:CAMPEP_0194285428 /NCGR_PEP_ID=MMETSP0169-20130528/30149_1 /TAXON_ID=218684 /ORGANISM="Corethron pennatum, Strain L29A3" /LENGTH=359 /DNA_ID=CAMNT_0039031543 /DNA_START=72 /DNA_END=1151 /DNA_ORIENTATION=+
MSGRLHIASPPADYPQTDAKRRAVLVTGASAAASFLVTTPQIGMASEISPRTIVSAAGDLSDGRLPLTVGLGTCLVRPGNDVVEQVGLAVDAGYRIFDTAQRYGNEAGVGKALRSGIIGGKIKREEVLVTSKVWVDNMGAEATYPSVRKSAAQLGLGGGDSGRNSIDLMLVHWPGRFVRRAGASPQTMAKNAKLREDTWRAMEDLKRDGVVKQIGVSNFSERHLRELLSYAKVRPAVNQFEIHPYNSRGPLVKLCRREGIAVEAYCPLGGKGNENSVTDELLKDPVLLSVGRAHRKTAAQVILRWHLQRDITPIPKASSKKRIEENQNVYDFSLTAIEMEAIAALNRDQFALFDADELA